MFSENARCPHDIRMNTSSGSACRKVVLCSKLRVFYRRSANQQGAMKTGGSGSSVSLGACLVGSRLSGRPEDNGPRSLPSPHPAKANAQAKAASPCVAATFTEDAARPAKTRGSLDAKRLEHCPLYRSGHERRAAVNVTRAHSHPRRCPRLSSQGS